MSESTTSAEPLSNLKPGQRGKVISIELPGANKGRIMEMGLTAGVTVEVIRYAPLGDPMELKVRGGHLSLRKSDAAGIRVQVL
jgi:Fe2+ transport system protein FeoA